MLYSQVRTTEGPESPTWRPWTLRTPSLIGFVLLCSCLLLGNELATLGCATNGCHIFGTSSDGNIPAASNFVYKQFPTVLSLCLSLLWILPHHDILRLEPYFRMSAEGGAKAAASLFLDYPYQITLLVPFKALKNKHYIVALSSLILLLMNLMIVPLVPNIFDKSTLFQSIPDNTTRASFNMTGRNVSEDFTYPAYARAWNNGELLPFMTDSFALLPVRPGARRFAAVETWTVETTLFEAGMKCEGARPPQIGYVNGSLTVNITSSDGVNEVRMCDAGALEKGAQVDSDNCDLHTGFIAPWTSIFHKIGNTNNSPASYMYAWASGPPTPPNITFNFTYPPPTNITAIFCTPVYHSETVNATFSMPSGKVLNISRSGVQKPLPALGGFNGILNGKVERHITGEGLVYGLPVRFGYPPGAVVSVELGLIKKFGMSSRPLRPRKLQGGSRSNVYNTDTNVLSAFALFGQTNETLGELLDARALENSNTRALKIMFAFAMATEMDRMHNNTHLVAVERRVQMASITVNQSWALAARVGLSVIVLLTVILVFLIKGRPCKLDGEPNSLAASLRLLAASPGLSEVMRSAEFYKPDELRTEMEKVDVSFKLDVLPGQGPAIHVTGGTGGAILEERKDQAVPVEAPWALRIITGAVFLASFAIVAMLLIFSFAYSRTHNGFPLPGGPNIFRSKVLYTYIPIAVGTAIEPILISLGAIHCMVVPYKALEAGDASYSKSLAVDYDRTPPHFQLVRALYTRQFTLAALTVAILLSNVLSVALAGLYSSTIEVPKIPRSHNVLQNITVARGEMYFELSKNLSSTTYSPTWTTPEYYIDPPYKLAPSGEGEYSTVGFGVDVACSLVAEERIAFPCSNNTWYANKTTTPVDCKAIRPANNRLIILDPCGTVTSKYLELRWNGSCGDRILQNSACTDKVFPAWGENLLYKSTTQLTRDDPHFVVLNCTVTDKIVHLTTTVTDGQVHTLSNINPLDATQLASLYHTPNTTAIAPLSRSFAEVLAKSINDEAPIFGNHPIGRINYLMAISNPAVVRTPSNDTHLPNAAIAVPTFSDILRRLFAIFVRISADDLFFPPGAAPASVSTTEVTYRVHMNSVNFALAVSILMFAIGVIIALYLTQEEAVVGHLPWSLAGMYAHLYASAVKEDLARTTRTELVQMKAENERLGRKYGYGAYPGGHHGVYRVEDGVDEVLVKVRSKEDRGVGA